MEINETVKIIDGDCLTKLDKLETNCIDCVVQLSYDTIKGRTGHTENGSFIKDGEC